MLLYFIINPVLWVCVSSGAYNQRQTGDLNVQLNIEDVQIFAFLKGGNKEEYVDYDYAYDYSELTIKPQNRTTPKPFNRTSTSTEQTNAIENSTISTMLIIQNNVTEASIASENTTSSISISDTSITTIKPSSESVNQVISDSTVPVTLISSQTPMIKNCRKGFVLNQKGDCQLRQNITGNALAKLVKLSQRLKLRRGNKSDNNS